MKRDSYLLNKVILSAIVVTILTMLGVNFGVKSLAQGSPTLTPWNFLPFLAVSEAPPTAETFEGGVINVTVHRNCDQETFADGPVTPLDSFIVDKKSANSILMVNGTISAQNLLAGRTNFKGRLIWQYGANEYIAQGGTESDYNIRPFVFETSVAISDHPTTGNQTLTFTYQNPSGRDQAPIRVINPEVPSLGITCSVYTVTEIG